MISIEPQTFHTFCLGLLMLGILLIIWGTARGLFSTLTGILYFLAYTVVIMPAAAWLNTRLPLGWFVWYAICLIGMSLVLHLFSGTFRLLKKIRIIGFLDHLGGFVLSCLLVWLIWRLFAEIAVSGLFAQGAALLETSVLHFIQA